MLTSFRLFLIVSLFFIHHLFNQANLFAVGFLKANGKVVVDGTGQEFYLKGIGLGGWLLQEGYMLHTSNFANSQWQIRQKIVELIGEANTEIFYETYRRNFIRKVDI
jgi:endoglucanase